MKVKKTILLAIGLYLGILITFSGTKFLYKVIMVHQNGIQTVATIVSTENDTGCRYRNTASKTCMNLTYYFSDTNDQKFFVTETEMNVDMFYRIGDQLSIIYSKNDPRLNISSYPGVGGDNISLVYEVIFEILFTVTGILLLIIILSSIIRELKRKNHKNPRNQTPNRL